MSKIAVKDVEVSEALNSLTKANLRGAVGDSALRDLINDYFCCGEQSSDSEEDGDTDGDGDGEDTTAEMQADSEDDHESVAVEDTPVVTVDVVSSMLYSSGGAGESVCDAADEELERVKKFLCGCHKSCYSQLSHDKVLNRRLEMKELTEGNVQFYRFSKL